MTKSLKTLLQNFSRFGSLVKETISNYFSGIWQKPNPEKSRKVSELKLNKRRQRTYLLSCFCIVNNINFTGNRVKQITKQHFYFLTLFWKVTEQKNNRNRENNRNKIGKIQNNVILFNPFHWMK
jgi:hypothetical protein